MFACSIFTDFAGWLTKLFLTMNFCMTIFTKRYQTMQTFKFMPDNRYATYFVGFMMNFQAISLTAHLTAMPVTNAYFTLNFFPIGIILQTRPILRRPPLLVRQSRHFHPPFSTGFLQLLPYAIHGVE